MNTSALIFAILFILYVLFWIISISSSEPYPKELQDKEDEELLEKFKEHKKSQDK